MPEPRQARTGTLRETKPKRRPHKRRAPYSSAFYADLPDPPVAGDLVQARLYWMRLCELIDDTSKVYARNERTCLRQLRDRWRRRAFGEDARWLLVGSKPGRLDRGVEAALRPAAAAGWGDKFEVPQASKI